MYEEEENEWMSNTGRTYYSSGSSHSAQKVSERSIIEDLAVFGFPEDIQYEANEIYRKLGMPVKRSKERGKMLFFCVYSAYKEKGSPVNPTTLRKKMNLGRGDVTSALRLFDEVQTGYRLKSKKTLPYDFIPQLCSELNIDHVKEDVLEVAQDVIEKCPSLLEEFPHKVAGGILRYYIEINGLQIPYDEFRRVVDFSDVTIRDIYDRITRIHNQE